MKQSIALLFTVVLLLASTVTAFAADGRVTYSGNAGNFVFESGGEYSLTDLFLNFKGVMPGDSLTQKITVKNRADNKVKVEMYVRSLGAHEDSAGFLSRLELKVQKSADNEMAYMFDAAANETAQLTDWVCLGTLYSGGEVGLDVTLHVPAELTNEFQNAIGRLDWEFKVVEFPIEPDDPKPPQTGVNNKIGVYAAILAGSLFVMGILSVWRKKDREHTAHTAKC